MQYIFIYFLTRKVLVSSADSLPAHIPYLLIGGGTASFSAIRAIRANDPDSKILLIGEEPLPPYMRPPLSKELWYGQDDELLKDFRFKQWSGKERRKVLSWGYYERISYAEDFQRLEDISRKGGCIAIVGGGFLGSELACALGRRTDEKKDGALKVVQIFPQAGNMGDILPEYLCKWLTKKVSKGKAIKLYYLNVDHVVLCVGVEPDLSLAKPSKLEVDPRNGGLLCDAELRVRNDVWTVSAHLFCIFRSFC
ncbi:unnamed protein product [Soboliphyme baturini]|uniref:Pyr_redox domain-containing protein n=1 Tax=Soboliphyme baturini TaxID=241478 RepID=A0A183J285_9BILA|nr:unnamed protein product [Soboliphyme baturini]